jgi:8-oxo-dGTP pyrophosphatase MutT (NUDIX family)
LAAQRELLEETGHTSSHWKPLGTFVVDGNRQCGAMHLFLARDASNTQPPREDAHEELEIELLDREQLVTALRTGELGNLAGASAIAMALALEL